MVTAQGELRLIVIIKNPNLDMVGATQYSL